MSKKIKISIPKIEQKEVEICGVKVKIDSKISLEKYGKIYIVTWQEGDRNKKIVIDWLSKHGLNYDGIFFTKNKGMN